MKERAYGHKETCWNCEGLETENHLFVECHKFQEWRKEAAEYIYTKIENTILEKSTENQKEKIKLNIQNIFKNSEIWVGGESFYYTGLIPQIIPPDLKVSDRDSKRIYDECHYTMVRLTGRIWGARARTAAQMSK
jgi:hypothetical protein